MDPENHPTLRYRLLHVFAGLVGLFFYVLSVGPAAYLATKSDMSIPLIEKLYTPLLLAARWTSLAPLLDRYLNWWESLP